MRTLLITSVNFPFGGPGSNYLRLFTKGLSERGWDVEVILLKGYIYGQSRFNGKRTNTYGKVKYTFCGFINRPSSSIGKIIDDILGIIFSAYYLIKYSNKVSNIFIYNNEAHLNFLNYLIATILKIKIVSFVAEGLDKANKKAPIDIPWADFFLNITFLDMKSSKLIVFSTYLRNYFQSRGYDPENILVIPNLLEMECFESDNFIRSGSKFRIGYCGSPSRKDGIEDLLESFRILMKKDSGYELLIIGDSTGRNTVLTDLKEKLRKDNLLDDVIFTGLIPFTEVPGMLKTCDVLVLARPSGVQSEAGFPTKLGEYLACKKPVVISRVGDMAAYFEDEVNILFAEPDKPISLSGKIAWVKNHPDKANSIALNGYTWAKNNLDYKSAIAKIEKFLS